MTITNVYEVPMGRIADRIFARVFLGRHARPGRITYALRCSFAGKSVSKRFSQGKPVRRFEVESICDQWREKHQYAPERARSLAIAKAWECVSGLYL